MQTSMSELTQLPRPLLRADQIEEARSELRRIHSMLADPRPFAGGQVQDRAQQTRNMRQLHTQLETETPRPYEQHDLDDAVRMEKQLREDWGQGMPTQAEMRRNPVGAVDKNVRWEKRAKPLIMAWKNIRRRLAASGALGDSGPEDRDIANIEGFRPAGGAQELNMAGEQIPGKDIYLPPPGVEPAVVMSERDRELLDEIDPELAKEVALMSNEAREKVRDFVRSIDPATGETPKKREYVMTPKRQAALLKTQQARRDSAAAKREARDPEAAAEQPESED